MPESRKLLHTEMKSYKARRKLYNLITTFIFMNKQSVDKIKNKELVISVLFFNFTNVLRRQKSCS